MRSTTLGQLYQRGRIQEDARQEKRRAQVFVGASVDRQHFARERRPRDRLQQSRFADSCLSLDDQHAQRTSLGAVQFLVDGQLFDVATHQETRVRRGWEIVWHCGQ